MCVTPVAYCFLAAPVTVILADLASAMGKLQPVRPSIGGSLMVT
jgi:hypothetical protein